MFGLAQKPCLTFPQFDLAGGDRASGDFVFESPDEVIELSILTAARNKEKRESAHARASAFRPRCHHGCLSPALLAKYLSPVKRQWPSTNRPTVATFEPRSDPPLISVIHVAPCHTASSFCNNFGKKRCCKTVSPYFINGASVPNDTV